METAKEATKSDPIMSYEEVVIRLREKETELEEFQESSRDLEQELESQLECSEGRNKELVATNQRLVQENEMLKAKLLRTTTDMCEQVNDLTKELTKTKIDNETLICAIRELEQSNDDLERAKRALACTLEDFENKFNEQIEKNVFLENELGDKGELEVIVQRLKDEARDLKSELMIQQQTQQQRIPLVNGGVGTTTTTQTGAVTTAGINRFPRRSGSLTSYSGSIPVLEGSPKKILPHQNHVITLNATSTPITNTNNTKHHHHHPSHPTPSGLSLGRPSPSSPGSPPNHNNNNNVNGTSGLPQLSPSTRVSALNIVSDLLRKVGALETKLNTCRNMVPPSPNRTTAPMTSSRDKPTSL